MSQSVAEGFNAYRQQGEQSTYDAEALVGAIFGDLPDDAGPEAACADTGGETAPKVVCRPLRRTIRPS